MRPRLILSLILAAALPACVTTGTYNQLKQRSDDLQSQLDEIHKEAQGLQSDLGTAKQANEQLNADKSTLSKEKSELEQLRDSLQSRTTELEAKTSQLTSQTAQLQDAQTQLKAQSDSLAAQNAVLAADKQTLQKQAADKQAQYDALVGDLKKEVNDGQLKITQYKNMLTVDVADKILFDSGKADLKADGKGVLTKVAAALAKGDKVIRVVGHTDNVRLAAGAAFASNWELSTARALAAIHFLTEKAGLDPRRVGAIGYGEYRPIADNTTAEGRAKNRRIEIAILPVQLAAAGSAPAAPPAASTNSPPQSSATNLPVPPAP